MTNTTKLTQRQLLDNRGILSAIMEQQPKRKKEFITSTTLNPIIFPSYKRNERPSILDDSQFSTHPAVVDSAYIEAFKKNEDIYEDGIRVPSHRQVRTNERNRNIGLVLNKQYETPRKYIPETELGTYASLDEIITAPMELEYKKPKVSKPIPIKRENISRSMTPLIEEIDIKKEFMAFRNKTKPLDSLREENIKKQYKYPLKHLKKQDMLLEHLSQIIEEE